MPVAEPLRARQRRRRPLLVRRRRLPARPRADHRPGRAVHDVPRRRRSRDRRRHRRRRGRQRATSPARRSRPTSRPRPARSSAPARPATSPTSSSRKLNAAGTALVYSTFVGGSDLDFGPRSPIDAAGNAYVTGQTKSSNFPTTGGAFDRTLAIPPNCPRCATDNTDGFAFKLNAAGSALVYSTYLGGTDIDAPRGIAVDGSGNAYVTGETLSTDFPTTAGAFQPHRARPVRRLRHQAQRRPARRWSTRPTSAARQVDNGERVAVDGGGNAYVLGSSSSTDFPTTPGAFDTTANGGFDATLTKLNPAGSALVYSTFLGGPDFDGGQRPRASTRAGNAYVAGGGTSADFPTTPGAFDTVDDQRRRLRHEAEPGRLGARCTRPSLGGSASDAAGGPRRSTPRATPGSPAARTPPTSRSRPARPTPRSTASATPSSASSNPTGSALLYSTFLGGSNSEGGADIARDPSGDVYVTGSPTRMDFPATVGAFDTVFNGDLLIFWGDAFVTKLDSTRPRSTPAAPPAVPAAPTLAVAVQRRRRSRSRSRSTGTTRRARRPTPSRSTTRAPSAHRWSASRASPTRSTPPPGWRAGDALLARSRRQLGRRRRAVVRGAELHGADAAPPPATLVDRSTSTRPRWSAATRSSGTVVLTSARRRRRRRLAVEQQPGRRQRSRHGHGAGQQLRRPVHDLDLRGLGVDLGGDHGDLQRLEPPGDADGDARGGRRRRDACRASRRARPAWRAARRTAAFVMLSGAAPTPTRSCRSRAATRRWPASRPASTVAAGTTSARLHGDHDGERDRRHHGDDHGHATPGRHADRDRDGHAVAPPPPPTTATLTVSATGRSGERVTSNPAGISVTTGSSGSASFTRRHVDHAHASTNGRSRDLVGRVLERRQQGRAARSRLTGAAASRRTCSAADVARRDHPLRMMPPPRAGAIAWGHARPGRAGCTRRPRLGALLRARTGHAQGRRRSLASRARSAASPTGWPRRCSRA